jgi:hypothetical protein
VSDNPEWSFHFPSAAAAAAGTEGPFHELAGEVLFPAAVDILASEKDQPNVKLRFELDLDSGRAVCVSLSFERAPGGDPIEPATVPSRTVIRALLTDAFVWEAANARAIVDVNQGAYKGQDGKLYVFREHDKHDTVRNARALRQYRSVTDALLREVAGVYQADTTGSPTEAVAEHFPTSKRTATRWLRLARDRGFLPEYERPTKKED